MKILIAFFFCFWLFCLSVSGEIIPVQPAFTNPFENQNYRTKDLNNTDAEKLRNQLEKQIGMLNSYAFSPELKNELLNTWQVLNESEITFAAQKNGEDKKIVALAAPFPDGFSGNEKIFKGTIFLSPAYLDSNEFLFAFLHELRHLRDVQIAWLNKTKIKAFDSEQNAYRLHSLLALETKTRFLKIPVLAESKWLSLDYQERAERVSKKVAKFLNSNSFYNSLVKSAENDIDFSTSKQFYVIHNSEQPMKIDDWTEGYLPPLNSTPENVYQTIQNRRPTEITLLPSPKLKSPQELLKTALANELAVRNNQQDFAIEINLSLECFEKKQNKSASLTEHLTPLSNGQFAFSRNQTDNSRIPCSDSIKNREFDISNIFWTHKNQELANSYFMGTEMMNNRLTAVYNFRPTTKAVSERIFVGTFYIDVEDAQIVKFYGEVQNRQTAHLASLNNLVTVWRRKSSNGIWLTSSVKSRGLLPEKQIPFSYSIEFNYKMTDSEVVILDDKTDVSTNQ